VDQTDPFGADLSVKPHLFIEIVLFEVPSPGEGIELCPFLLELYFNADRFHRFTRSPIPFTSVYPISHTGLSKQLHFTNIGYSSVPVPVEIWIPTKPSNVMFFYMVLIYGFPPVMLVTKCFPAFNSCDLVFRALPSSFCTQVFFFHFA